MPVKGGHGPPPVLRPPFAGMALIFRHKHKTLLLVLFLIVSSSSGLSNSEILLKFKASLSNDSALANWRVNTSPCQGDLSNWSGVICVNGSVWGLQLERMGLMGTIDVQSLELISDLRTLSFMNNNFQGPVPVFNKLGSMRSLYLSNNHFSGQIPDDAFQGMLKLNKVYLANNEFSGSIPSSLTDLPKLLELRLEGNKFSGNLPNFRENFTSFNVSNNQLEGQIPDSLSKFDLTSFSGNKGLCGSPLSPCTQVPNSTNNASNYGSNSIKNSSNPSLASIIIVIIVAVVAVGAIIAAAFILTNRRKQQQLPLSIETPPPNSQLKIRKVFKYLPEQAPRVSPDGSSTSKKPDTAKLSFVRDDIEKFDLPDLLRASAEILGSGCFGSSYRAALANGSVMVVKRFKQMNNVGKEEFHEHMRRLGRLRHPNLLPLVAYYYRKEEKLLITEFVQNRSLANLLHGRHSEGQECLNWETRLKIAKGVAKGLGYLYKELPSIIASHGHLKSSNILLNQSYEPIISDYGLVPVINQENAHELMAAYRSPEYLQLGRITRKTDVWSFGILIIELLSGNFPPNFLTHGSKGNDQEDDLANWVKSFPEEEWMNQVIDKDMRATKNIEGEIIKLLKIGLSCCEEDLDERLDLKQVVERLDEIKEKDNDDNDNDNDIYSSSDASEGEDGQMILLSPE